MVIAGFQSRVRSNGLSWLKPGFRHCFVYQSSDQGWLLCDPLADGILLRAAPRIDAVSLMTTLAALEASVVLLENRVAEAGPSSLRLLTCVEVCKRLLGMTSARLLTPHQLFRRLLVAPQRTIDVELI